MDDLEKHIRKVRDELDIHQPGQEIWNRIEKDLPGRQVRLRSVIWRAAVAVIIAGAAFTVIAGVLLTSGRLNNPQMTEVRETYRYYDEKIKALYNEAEPLLTSNPDISSELSTGMDVLDSLSAQIISDLDDNIASSEVIEALIGNYRLRIELLEDMLRLMKENGNDDEKTPDHEL